LPIGGKLQELDFIGGEPAGGERTDVNHAQQAASNEQRNTEQRTNAPVHQKQIDHVRRCQRSR
jgi:hypothetical protein